MAVARRGAATSGDATALLSRAKNGSGDAGKYCAVLWKSVAVSGTAKALLGGAGPRQGKHRP